MIWARGKLAGERDEIWKRILASVAGAVASSVWRLSWGARLFGLR